MFSNVRTIRGEQQLTKAYAANLVITDGDDADLTLDLIGKSQGLYLVLFPIAGQITIHSPDSKSRIHHAGQEHDEITLTECRRRLLIATDRWTLED